MPSKQLGSVQKFLINRDAAIRKELSLELRATAGELNNSVLNVVRDWKNRPSFMIIMTVQTDYLCVELIPSGPYRHIFTYIDKGTGRYGSKGKAYEIKPKKKEGFLKFQTGYSAFTKPIAQYNVGTGKKFGPWVSVKSVIHPGIKPRYFLKTQGEKLTPPFPTRINAAILRAIRSQFLG